MRKEETKYEKHEDLCKFEIKYNNRINKFLASDPETRIVFLNADFGWGKTTFIKNNLKIKENQIYSPWLNKSDNYIEEIYYNITKKDKGILSSIALFISVILTMITILAGSIISILIELSKDSTYIVQLLNVKLIYTSNDKLNLLLLCLLSVISFIILLLGLFIFLKPIPIINFFKKDNGKYYENRIIKKIVEKMDKILVIEDIDRTDDIEDILIVANKISEYIKVNKLDKYILITGDYVRMIRRISEPNIYDNTNLNLSTYRNKGTFVIEKIISLRIDFSTIYERIDTLLLENHLNMQLTKIEYDEIVAFIQNKYLSIRFFIRFLEKYKPKITKTNSLYHLLLKYYQEEKYFNLPNNVIENSIYNIERFPNCINDIEMMLQKEGIVINNIIYNNIEIKDFENNNYDIINNAFAKLFFYKNVESISIFKEFYETNKFPVLATDKRNYQNYNNMINVGDTLRPINLKNDLNNYLLGYNNNEVEMNEGILVNKRCYFPTVNTTNNYEFYKINQVNIIDTIEVTEDKFIIAYIAAFLKKNDREIKNNYPKLMEKILEILK